LPHSFRDGYAECSAAVQDGDTILEFRDLAIGIPCHEPRAQQFHAVHHVLDAAAPAVLIFQILAFLRSGMTARAPRSATASWHLRLSQVPSSIPFRRPLAIACRPVETDLAPDAAFGAIMLAGMPFAFTFDLDARAVHCPAGH
jgi:hypothetical protein